MSTPNDNSPLARLRHHVTGAIERGEATPIVEQALAEEKANQEKIGATVQSARASATQPDNGIEQANVNREIESKREQYCHNLELCNNALQTEVAIRKQQLDALQAQRDELLAACRLAHAALTDHGRWLPDEYQQAAHACSAAIARATSKQGLGWSDAESISTEGGRDNE